MSDLTQENIAQTIAAAEAEVPVAQRAVPEQTEQNGAVDTPPSTPASGRRFTLLFLGMFILVYGACLAINWVGNSSGLFPSKINPAMSERAWKTRRIEAARDAGRAPKVIVLGSSRMMQIRPDYLEAAAGKAPAFNYAVSAAGPVDWLAQLRYLISSGAKPEIVIVGADEFSFGTLANRFQLQLGGNWALFNEVPLRERSMLARDILLQTDLESTRDSFKVIAHPPKVRARNMKRVDHFSIGDGYLIYKNHIVDRAKSEEKFDLEGRVRRQAVAWRNNVNSQSDPIESISPSARKVALFREFLDLAKANGIEVKVILPPLHPDFERRALAPQIKAVRENVHQMLQKMCAEHGFAYRDFRSFKTWGGKAEDFWDAFHPTSQNTRRMVNVLFGHKAEAVLKEVPPDAGFIRNPPKVTDLNTW